MNCPKCKPVKGRFGRVRYERLENVKLEEGDRLTRFWWCDRCDTMFKLSGPLLEMEGVKAYPK